MTKRLLEISMTVFFLVVSLSIIVFMVAASKAVGSYMEVMQEQISFQQEVMESAQEGREIVSEFFTVGVFRALIQQRLVSPAEGEKIIQESLAKVSNKSEKWALLLRALNDSMMMMPQGGRG